MQANQRLTEIIIRQARLEDAPEIARLVTQLGYPSSAAQMQARLAAILAHPAYQTFMAQAAGQVVGMVGACTGLAYEKDGVYGRLVALVVDDNRHGQGIGAALVEAAEGWMISQGATSSVVTSRHHRKEAHQFYRQLGYQDTGIRFVKELSTGQAG